MQKYQNIKILFLCTIFALSSQLFSMDQNQLREFLNAARQKSLQSSVYSALESPLIAQILCSKLSKLTILEQLSINDEKLHTDLMLENIAFLLKKLNEADLYTVLSTRTTSCIDHFNLLVEQIGISSEEDKTHTVFWSDLLEHLFNKITDQRKKLSLVFEITDNEETSTYDFIQKYPPLKQAGNIISKSFEQDSIEELANWYNTLVAKNILAIGKADNLEELQKLVNALPSHYLVGILFAHIPEHNSSLFECLVQKANAFSLDFLLKKLNNKDLVTVLEKQGHGTLYLQTLIARLSTSKKDSWRQLVVQTLQRIDNENRARLVFGIKDKSRKTVFDRSCNHKKRFAALRECFKETIISFFDAKFDLENFVKTAAPSNGVYIRQQMEKLTSWQLCYLLLSTVPNTQETIFAKLANGTHETQREMLSFILEHLSEADLVKVVQTGTHLELLEKQTLAKQWEDIRTKTLKALANAPKKNLVNSAIDNTSLGSKTTQHALLRLTPAALTMFFSLITFKKNTKADALVHLFLNSTIAGIDLLWSYKKQKHVQDGHTRLQAGYSPSWTNAQSLASIAKWTVMGALSLPHLKTLIVK